MATLALKMEENDVVSVGMKFTIRAIVNPLLGFLSEREDIVPHGVFKDTVVRNRGAHLLLAMRHALLRYRRRIKMC